MGMPPENILLGIYCHSKVYGEVKWADRIKPNTTVQNLKKIQRLPCVGIIAVMRTLPEIDSSTSLIQLTPIIDNLVH